MSQVYIGSSSGGGSPSFMTATVNVTSAQLLSLAETPVTLLPAPGVGKVNFVLNIVAILNYNTTPYNTSNPSDVNIAYNSDDTYQITGISLVPFFSQSSEQILPIYPSSSALANASNATEIENTPITLLAVFGDMTEGDSSATFIINYTILTLG